MFDAAFRNRLCLIRTYSVFTECCCKFLTLQKFPHALVKLTATEGVRTKRKAVHFIQFHLLILTRLWNISRSS